MSGDCDFNWRPPKEPTIPFGYKRISGPSQKGDGIWNGVRFAKVRKGYPFAGDSGSIIIRRCEVQQTEIAVPELGACETMEVE